MSGLAEARQVAKEHRLKFIPGIEFSTETGSAELQRASAADLERAIDEALEAYD